MSDVSWPAAVVAIALIAMVGAISIAAITVYNVDDALKIWSALSGVVGILTGAFVTYFFTRQSVESARTGSINATTALQAATKLAGELPKDTWNDVKNDPTIQRALEPVEP